MQVGLLKAEDFGFYKTQGNCAQLLMIMAKDARSMSPVWKDLFYSWAVFISKSLGGGYKKFWEQTVHWLPTLIAFMMYTFREWITGDFILGAIGHSAMETFRCIIMKTTTEKKKHCWSQTVEESDRWQPYISFCSHLRNSSIVLQKITWHCLT